MNHFTTMQSEEIEIWIYTFMIKWKIKVLKQISMDGIEFDNLKKKRQNHFQSILKFNVSKQVLKKKRIWYIKLYTESIVKKSLAVK